MQKVKSGYIVYNPQNGKCLQKGYYHTVGFDELKKVNFCSTKKGAEKQLAHWKEEMELCIEHCDKRAKESFRTQENKQGFLDLKLCYEAELLNYADFEIREITITAEIK